MFLVGARWPSSPTLVLWCRTRWQDPAAGGRRARRNAALILSRFFCLSDECVPADALLQYEFHIQATWGMGLGGVWEVGPTAYRDAYSRLLAVSGTLRAQVLPVRHEAPHHECGQGGTRTHQASQRARVFVLA